MYLEFAKNTSWVECSHHIQKEKEGREETTVGPDGYVNKLDCGDHFTMYTHIETSSRIT